MVSYRFSTWKCCRVSLTPERKGPSAPPPTQSRRKGPLAPPPTQSRKGSCMALVILVRHGQTDENINGRISGQGPVPINARGQEQARLAAEVLAPLGITHIFSSPLVRARQTAEFLAGRLQKPIEEIPDLCEVGYGDWEGKTFGEMRGHPVAHQVFNDPIN